MPPFGEETELDYIFIPHEDLIDEFCSQGIPKAKLIPLGIPIRPIFKSSISISKAKELLNYDSKKKHIMIMGGSMGAGDIYNLSRGFINSFNSEEITIICGTNLKLYKSLKALKLNSNVKILGFVNNISEIMDSADILISKAGGLTSTEAMFKNIPIVLINPIPGVETNNCNFFTKHKMALHAKSIEKSISLCKEILETSSIQDEIIESQKNNINKNSTIDIINFLLNKFKENSL